MYFMLFIREFLSISLFNKKIEVKKLMELVMHTYFLYFFGTFFLEKERKRENKGEKR
jgi:formate/nitrite transporter FocA (FNT family)